MRFGSARHRAIGLALSILLLGCGTGDIFVDTGDEDRDGVEADAGDCNDDDPAIHPGAEDIPYDGIDQNCTGTDLTDIDDDGVDGLLAPGGTDCDDHDRAVHPGALEVCDEKDNDCDGDVDLGAVDLETFWRDLDGDGYGDPDDPVEACEAGLELAGNDDDCDDRSASAFPGGLETCDSRDNDCDGGVDDGVATTYYPDLDRDGHGDPARPTPACSLPTGYTADATDCNDAAAADHPGGTEVCDGRDNDCDQATDEGVATLYYTDVDRDGFGDPAAPAPACALEPGFSANDDDCNDRNQDVHPGAPEVCNDRDDDCDQAVDEGIPTSTYYRDADEDGYGSDDDIRRACSAAPPGYVIDGGDCEDDAPSIHPEAEELCNEIDDDCDGDIDDDAGVSYYRDADGDGYGNPLDIARSCDGGVAGHVSNKADCNDDDAAVKPGALELAGDNIDQNCDGKETCFKDGDSDGYRPDETSTVASSDTDCRDAGEAFANAPTGDCNDADASIRPGATEGVGDQRDQDCDGKELCYKDSDDDGYRPDSSSTVLSADPDCADSGEAAAGEPIGDCFDADSGISPAAQERCDAVDNDCDGLTDDADPTVVGQKTYYRDRDSDGYGTTASGTFSTCGPRPGGYSTFGTDCNDDNKNVYPGAVETCDNVDNDCDGKTDDADSPVANQTTFYKDNDRDGYGSAASGTTKSCAEYPPSGFEDNNLDCDDSTKNIKPGAPEICDAIDNDCDGKIDDADFPVTGQKTYYIDTDADGFGTPADTVLTCASVPPRGYAPFNTDCDDRNKSVNPGAQEICNTLDDDCDGKTDDADPTVIGQLTYYRDQDQDGYGSGSSGALKTCNPTPPPGYSLAHTDCNDLPDNPATPDVDESGYDINPDAEELCNGRDDDCDLQIDEAGEFYFRDADGDGYGDPDDWIDACLEPDGYVPDDTDCDDGAATVNPDADELPGNGIDDDCDGIID